MKRVFDIISSAIGLIITAPLWPIIALAIKLDSYGPVLVRLARVSQGKIIYVYKFRSMIDGAHHIKPALASMNQRRGGPFFKIKHDPRLTRVGKFIRKFRLDELPQLLNVLKGELSLVGPRPHEPEEVIFYPDDYKYLMLAKAGVTGLSQVNGASSLPFLDELYIDHYYVKYCNFWTDIKVIGKTVAILFSDPTAV